MQAGRRCEAPRVIRRRLQVLSRATQRRAVDCRFSARPALGQRTVSRPDSLSRFSDFMEGRQAQLAVTLVYPNHRSVGHLPRKNAIRERILQILLHRALERSRSVYRIIADTAKPSPRRVAELE